MEQPCVRVIIKAMRERQTFVDEIREQVPSAEVCWDEKRCSIDTFLRSMDMVGDEAAIHLEEDIQLCEDFVPKINAAIAERPDTFIQFFSMRKADLTVGSRWDRNFLMNQCFYAPPEFSKAIRAYYPIWPDRKLHPGGPDMLVCDWLKARKLAYWIHVPSLVDHRVAVSMIDKRRSSKRQSFTFGQ